jgi:tetratricopeptide (TPR) repeat protein
VPDLQKQIIGADQVIRHNGYVVPQDLYMAQGYISYLQGDFERSVQSLSEALTLVPEDAAIIRHLEAARANMTAEQTRKLIESEFAACKSNYEAGNFRGSLASCEKVLAMKADHIEAAAYADDARKRINEPIERELKIATAKFEQRDFLGVLKHLQVVKTMDPQNAEATTLMDQALAELEKEASLQPEAQAGQTAVYQIDSKKSREFYGQGLMLYSQGKLDDAATAWGQAVKYDNSNTLARNAYNRVITELKEQRP